MKRDILIVVDMQKDFVTGALGSTHELLIVSSAASCFCGVTPAQQSASTEIGISGI